MVEMKVKRFGWGSGKVLFFIIFICYEDLKVFSSKDSRTFFFL